MDKRYQVFVSSTYADLKEERRRVIQTLMEMDCIPSGMELFPAADEEQWEFIKKVINDCDYYLLIIGGRYGTTTPEGVSYTEKEYDYAIEKGVKVIALLHEKPEAIPVAKSETNPKLIERLNAFRNKVSQNRLVRYWNTAEELPGLVSLSLSKTIKTHPAVGWVRADLIPDESASKEILSLKKRIEELNAELERVRFEAPKGAEGLAQGEDRYEVHYSYVSYRVKRPSAFLDYVEEVDITNEDDSVVLTWNEIFSCVSPFLIDEATELTLISALNEFIKTSEFEKLNREHQGKKLKAFHIDNDDFQTIKVQLRALGLITKNSKQRSVRDTATYWTLTPYGDTVMTKLRAIKRSRRGIEIIS